MAKTTRLAASNISGTNGLGFDFEIKSDYGSLTASDSQHEITILPAGGLVFDFDSGDMFEPFDPIVSSSLSLSFFATHDDQLTDIVSMNRGGEKATYIKVRMWKSLSQNQYWYGVIVPEETRYEVTDGRTMVTMKFADGIKMLDAEEFSDLSGGVLTGWMTNLEAVNTILRKIPWVDEELSGVDLMMSETPFLDIKDWTDNAGHTHAKSGMFRRTGFIGTTYLKDKGNTNDGRQSSFSEAESCLKVLRDICINFGYKVCWNGESFHFFSPLNYTDDALGQSAHPTLEYQRDQSGSQQGSSELFQASQDMDNHTKVRGGAYRVFSNAYNEALVTHDVNKASNIIGSPEGRFIKATTNGGDQNIKADYEVNDYRISAGGQLSLRIAGTVQHNYQGNLSDTSRKVIIYAVVSLKVGNYYLAAPSMSSVSTESLDGNDFQCPDRDLSAAYWTTSPSYIEIPYTTGFGYASPTADMHLDEQSFIPLSVKHDGNGGYSKDDERNLVGIDYVLITPELPLDSVGIEMTQTIGGTTNNLSQVNGIDHNAQVKTFFTASTPAAHYMRQTAFLYEGESQDSPIYSSRNSAGSFYDVLDLGKTNMGPRLNRVGNNGFLSSQQYDGSYTFDAEYVDSVDDTSGSSNNIGRLLTEWYRVGGVGMEGLECSFVYNPSTGPHWLNWPDAAIKTTKIVGSSDASYFLPSSMTYDVSGDIEFSGLLIDRDAAISLADDEKEEQGTGRPITATIDGRVVSSGGGGGVSAGDLQDSKDDTDLLAIFISRN